MNSKKINMKFFKISICVVAVGFSSAIFAGNEDRAGSAGATDLLVNPWARSSAWGSAGISSVQMALKVSSLT